MPKVTFRNQNQTVNIFHGTSILEAAIENKIPIYHTCGGNASCSTCRVLIREGAENLSAIESAESQILDAFDLKPPHRLGCQALVVGISVTVEIPEHEKPCRDDKIKPLTQGPKGKY